MPASTSQYTFMMVALFAVAFSLGFTTASHGDDAETSKKLQGTWMVASAVHDGMPLKSAEGARFKFAGDKVEMSGTGKQATFTVKIDTAAKPHHIDFISTADAEDKLPPLLGVFQFEGEKFKLLISGHEVTESTNDKGEKIRNVTAGKRPTALDSKQGMLTTLERVEE